MATTLTSGVRITVTGNHTNTLDLEDAVNNLSLSKSDSLANGTSANQADLIWHDTRSAAGSADALDLAASLTDAFGNTLTFAKIKGIFIHNKSTTSGYKLAVGANAAALINWVAASGDIVNVGPDGYLLVWSPIDGYAVTGTSADILQIDPGANTVAYDIVIIGTSA